MVVNDNLILDIAQSIEAQSYWNALTTSPYTASPTDTNIGTEVGSRIALSNTRIDNEVTITGIRSGASVVGPTGDTLEGAGLFDAVTVGNLEASIKLPGLIQTSNFDVEITWVLSVARRS